LPRLQKPLMIGREPKGKSGHRGPVSKTGSEIGGLIEAGPRRDGDRGLSWGNSFFDPIMLPDGRKLVTLRDAARYITALPKAEHDADEWQAATEVLLLVAEHDGPTMFARIGVMRALRRHEPKAAAAPRRKRAKVFKIVR
jgi:hypothetical protein